MSLLTKWRCTLVHPQRIKKEFRFRIKCTEKQQEFLESTKRYVIFRGGIGAGKTRILCYKAIMNAMRGRKQLCVANTFTQLRDVVLATFVESLPLFGLVQKKHYTINRSDMDIIINGVYIHLRSAEQEEKLRGLNVHDVLIDEARNIKTNNLFLILIGRLRNSTDGQVFICTTPHGKDWVWNISQDTDCHLITQKTDENPFIPDQYIADLRSKYSTRFASQELDAQIISLSGAVISSKWFGLVDYCKPMTGVRAWDIAVTIKTHSDFSSGLLLHHASDGYVISNIIHGKYEYPNLKRLIIEMAEYDGKSVIIALEDAGQQRAIIDDLRHDQALAGYVIRSVRPQGDKMSRAMPWISRAEHGSVKIAAGPWNQAWLDECDSFTNDMSHEHDDMIDSMSMAYKLLSEPQAQASHVRLY